MMYRFLLKNGCLPIIIFLLLTISGCDRYQKIILPEHVIEVNEDNIAETIRTSQGILLVHFTSYDPRCGYCAPSNPYTDELTENYIPALKVARIHWEPWTDYSNLKHEYNILGIPLYVLYKDGTETWRAYGYTRETHRDLESQLEACCSKTY